MDVKSVIAGKETNIFRGISVEMPFFMPKTVINNDGDSNLL
jgi:hypothetical protein